MTDDANDETPEEEHLRRRRDRHSPDPEADALKRLRYGADNPTIPEMVPKYVIDQHFQKLKEDLRKEFVTSVDRNALQNAITEAKEATRKAEAATQANLDSRATSHRRFMRLIAAHVATLVALLVLAALLWVGAVYAAQNRERIINLERFLLDRTKADLDARSE